MLTEPAEIRQPAAPVPPRPIPPTVRLSDGPVFYREWVPGPSGGVWWLGAFLGLGLAIVPWFLSPLPALSALITLIGLALVVTAWSFRGLFIRVDERAITWRFGGFFRRYSLSEVSMFRESTFVYRRRLPTWGIGSGNDGLDRYQVWGGEGPVLDLVVQRRGKSLHYLLSSAAPERLAAALVRAIEARKKLRSP